MTAYNFGIGAVVGYRTDVANAQPSFFGTIQDISIDVDQALVELYGQYKMPADVAPGKMKITGKAKYARLQANQINNMLLGNTLTSASGIDMTVGEAQTPAATTFTVTNGTSYIADMGVFYVSNGKQLQPTTATPAAGYYIAGAANTGTYTINSADETSLTVYYTYNVTTQNKVVGSNLLLGSGPIFKLTAVQHYTNNLGVSAETLIQLNACRSSKITFPFNNIAYTIPELDFQAFADQSNSWGTLVFTE